MAKKTRIPRNQPTVASSPQQLQPLEASPTRAPHPQEEFAQQSRQHDQVLTPDNPSSSTGSIICVTRASKKRKSAALASSRTLATDDNSSSADSDSSINDYFSSTEDDDDDERTLRPESESGLVLIPQSSPPKRKRGPRRKAAKTNIEEEFSMVMRVMVMLVCSNIVLENADQRGEAAAGDAHRREISLRLESVSFESDTLATSSKEMYITYIKFFKEFCDDKYSFENDSRYEVYADKVLVFFRDVMFTRRIPKVFNVKDKMTDMRVAIGMYTDAKPRSNFQPEDLKAYLKLFPAAEDGTKTIEVYCGSTVMDQALKALVYLQMRQKNRLVRPNLSGHLRKCRAITDTLKSYQINLIYAQYIYTRNWSAHCRIRNTYSIDEHIRCLLDMWQQPVSVTSIGQKLHMCFAMRHAMILRDQDLRGLNYSDIFMEPAANVAGGTQALVYLTFTFHKSKTNKTGKLEYSLSVRHTDVRRCSVGALAFYFYDLFHVKKEPAPDWDDPNWVNTKVIHNWPDVMQEVSYESQKVPLQKVLDRQRLPCRQATHSGRHSGTAEAKMLRIRREDIKKAGRWKTNNSKMEEFYDDEPSYMLAIEMAGFLGGQVPFHLKRNEVSPDLDLQRQIFPFIETAFGPEGTQEYDAWQVDCIHEMEERNANDPSQLTNVLPLQYDPNVRGCVSSATRDSDRTKMCFLKALLRLRRVILQDAAEYLCRFTDVQSPLLKFGVLTTPAFEDFKEQVRKALQVEGLILPDDMHPNVKAVLQEQQRLIARQGETLSRLPTDYDKLREELLLLRYTASERLDQAMLFLDAKLEQSVAFLNEKVDRLESMMSNMMGMMIRLDASNVGCGYCRDHPTSPMMTWQALASSQSSFQRVSGHPQALPALMGLQPEASRSISAATLQTRPLAPAPIRVMEPLRWTPLSHPTPPVSMPTRHIQQHAYLTIQQPSSSTTTVTTTTTTTTTAGGFTVNYKLDTVEAIYEQHQAFNEARRAAKKKTAKALGLSRAAEKQLNNNKRIVEQVDYLAKTFREKDTALREEDALKKAMSDLNKTRREHHWTINGLVDHCRDEKKTRHW